LYRTKKHGEDAPEMADLYVSYGKALLENAISQASVLGKEPEPGAAEDNKRRTSRRSVPKLHLTRFQPLPEMGKDPYWHSEMKTKKMGPSTCLNMPHKKRRKKVRATMRRATRVHPRMTLMLLGRSSSLLAPYSRKAKKTMTTSS
jgi:hypothetical protein